MPAACGVACEVCGFIEVCKGPCVSGTDPRASEWVEKLKTFGITCAVLECAIKNKVDYCLKCDEFPCNVLYEGEFPYSKNFLDIFKKFKEEK